MLSFAAAAGSNKAASSSTSLNTRKLDEETENLTRECLSVCIFQSFFSKYPVPLLNVGFSCKEGIDCYIWNVKFKLEQCFFIRFQITKVQRALLLCHQERTKQTSVSCWLWWWWLSNVSIVLGITFHTC